LYPTRLTSNSKKEEREGAHLDSMDNILPYADNSRSNHLSGRDQIQILTIDTDSLNRRLKIVQAEIERVRHEQKAELQKLDAVLNKNSRLKICLQDDQ
jgi:uncharacterized small protein (DUF1192 family)